MARRQAFDMPASARFLSGRTSALGKCAQRGGHSPFAIVVVEVISFRDPAGNRAEAFHGGQIADEPFRPARHIGGFRTGTQGVGHAVLMMPEIDAALTFYRDLLGFRITDFMGPPVLLLPRLAAHGMSQGDPAQQFGKLCSNFVIKCRASLTGRAASRV